MLTNFLDSSVILCICFSLFQMCHPINWSAGSWSEKNKTIISILLKRERERDLCSLSVLVSTEQYN